MDGVADLTARVFASEEERELVFELTRAAQLNCPFMPPELCWVVKAEGRLVAKLQVLDFQVRVAGMPIRIGGIQGLVAEPSENHKGYATAIARNALPEIAAKGFDFVAGFAQRGAWYSRLGAVPLMAEYDVSLDSHDVPRLREDPFEVWDESRLPELIEFYNTGNRDRSGTLVRSVEYWPWMLRKPSELYICEDGYFGVERKIDHVEIRDIGGRGEAFHDAVARKLAEIGREMDLRWVNAQLPPDHPLAMAAVAYGARLSVRHSKRSGCMGLCLDPFGLLQKIAPALEERLRRSECRDVRVDLGVSCRSEKRHFSLNSKGSRERRVELRLDPGRLLQLAFGYRPLRSLLADSRLGSKSSAAKDTAAAANAEAAAPDEESLRLLDVLFPCGHPHMSVADRY